MKRLTCMAIVAGLLVGGCSSANVSTEPKEQPVEEKKQETVQEGKGESDKQSGTTEQVVLDEQFLKLLAKNEIGGFPIAIGTKKEAISAQYGKVIKQDYWDGGQYNIFEKLEGALLYFDGQDRLYAIDLAGHRLSETKLETIRKNLGAPVSEDKSMADQDYVMYFEAGDNSVFIHAKDEQSSADKIRIINKKMIEESPPKE